MQQAGTKPGRHGGHHGVSGPFMALSRHAREPALVRWRPVWASNALCCAGPLLSPACTQRTAQTHAKRLNVCTALSLASLHTPATMAVTQRSGQAPRREEGGLKA
jgi:hypothetical protein